MAQIKIKFNRYLVVVFLKNDNIRLAQLQFVINIPLMIEFSSILSIVSFFSYFIQVAQQISQRLEEQGSNMSGTNMQFTYSCYLCELRS